MIPISGRHLSRGETAAREPYLEAPADMRAPFWAEVVTRFVVLISDAQTEPVELPSGLEPSIPMAGGVDKRVHLSAT